MIHCYSSSFLRASSVSILSCILLLLPAVAFAQGRIPKAKDGSIKGALAFFPQSKLAEGFHTATSPFHEKTDPVLEPRNWVYSDDKRVAVKGFVKDAVLLFQWWTLLGDPIEKYAFKWTTSGYYEVQYEEKGQTVFKTIYRSDLVKYPDLLKKFDRIEPMNVNVKISFSSGDIDDQKYYDFRRKYNILSDLGSAGYKSSYTIESLGVHYLYAPSGQDAPFILPTMAVGGWPDFLNVDKKDDERTKRNIELFRLGRVLNIQSFEITDFEWQFGPFIEIARQFERYEKKEDSPREVAEKAGLAGENDGGDDFWNHAEVLDAEMEVYRDPTNGKYGLKAKKGLRAIPAAYNELIPSEKKGVFLGVKGDGRVYAVNNSGKEIASQKGYIYKGKVLEQYVDEKMDCYLNYYYSLYNLYSFSGGAFVKSPTTLFTVAHRSTGFGSLIVTSANEKRDYEAERRAKDEDDRKRDECYRTVRAKRSSLQSSGYTEYEQYFK